MKRIIKCRVTIFLLLGWAVLSAIGYMGRNNIYKAYRKDVRTTPYFVMVFEGIHDGVWPWMMSGMPWERGQNVAGGGPGGGDEALFPGTEAAGGETEAVGGETEGEAPGTDDGAVSPGADNGAGNAQPGTEGTGAADGSTGAAGDGTESPAGDGTESPAGGAGDTQAPGQQTKDFVQVDESWFDNAVFIGDSRTVGLRDYGGLEQATFYATVGMNVYDLWEEKFCEVDGEKLTLEEALTAKQYGKVYFQIGINEMGTGTIDSFMQEYTAAVERLKELQPNAIIYVQGIMRVTQKKSDADPIFNNRGIQLRNERIALLADNVRVFYIDMNEAVCNDAGNLREDLTFDELHLYGSKYGIWVDFLLTKGVSL